MVFTLSIEMLCDTAIFVACIALAVWFFTMFSVIQEKHIQALGLSFVFVIIMFGIIRAHDAWIEAFHSTLAIHNEAWMVGVKLLAALGSLVCSALAWSSSLRASILLRQATGELKNSAVASDRNRALRRVLVDACVLVNKTEPPPQIHAS